MSSNPFESGLISRLKQAFKTKNMNAAANALFGPTVDKYNDYFLDLKSDLRKADMDVLYRTYVSKIFLYTLLAYLGGVVVSLTYASIKAGSIFEAARIVIGGPIAAALLVGGTMYVYPSQKAKRRQASINENMPFALNHLSAIATSGIGPSSMFELLQTFDEYGAISDEAGEISRRVNVFGEDLTTALQEVAEQSPSKEWAEILYGILSTVEKGGDLESFLKEESEEALFDYKIQREKEIEKISTYASFYTAILIAAPVFLVVILSVMNLLGGDIAGFAIRDLMFLGIHILIPLLNLGFIVFLTLKVD